MHLVSANQFLRVCLIKWPGAEFKRSAWEYIGYVVNALKG